MSITKVQINRATVGNLSGSRSFTSSSLASRLTTEATNVDNLQTDSGSFSTRVTDLVTASSSFSGSIATLRGAGSLQGVGTSDSPTFAGATITGTLTAQEIHTEFESASIIFSSGSTIFGDTSDDTHRMTGSLNISGSLGVNDGNVHVVDKMIVGSGSGFNFNDESNAFVVAAPGNNAGLQVVNQTGDQLMQFRQSNNNAGDLILFGAGSTKVRFSSNGSDKNFINTGTDVGIGTNNPDNNLHIYNGDSGGSSHSNAILTVENNGRTAIQLLSPAANDQYIFFGDNGANNRAWISYDHNASPNLMTFQHYSDSGNFAFSNGKVGIGTTNPGERSSELLTIHAGTSNDGDVTVLRLNNDESALADGDGVSMMFGLGTDYRDAGKIGVFSEDNSHDLYNMRFSVRDGVNTLREYMRIKGSNGNITTVTGSALSYQSNGSTSAPSATTPVVFTQPSASIVQIDDSNNRYKKMFSQQVAKSGTARIKFTARNVSGTYWWSWLISRNNGSGSIDVESPTPMKLHNGNNAASSYAGGLADGESASVHNFRKFDITVKDVVAGDFIELWMRSSDGSGGQVTGNGQDLLAKDFQILSTTPSIESNAILPGTPKGQGLWEVIDKVVLTSNTSILSHPTCFANGSKYSHFKIVVGWLGTTAQESIFMRFLYNGGSSAYSAGEYYNTKVQTEHDTTSLNVEIQNQTSHIDLFNQTNPTNIGGVHGEIKIYNISAPIIRNGYDTRLQDVDTNRGTAYRAIGRSVLFGYDDQNDSYGQQVTNFRWNQSEVANDTINGYSGFQMFPGSGNFYAQSYVIICGFRVDDEYTLGTTDI